jgi:hypothetical protein
VHINEALQLLPQRGANRGCSVRVVPKREEPRQVPAVAEPAIPLKPQVPVVVEPPIPRKAWTRKYFVPAPGTDGWIGGRGSYGVVVASIDTFNVAVAETELLRLCRTYPTVDFVLLGSSGVHNVFQIEIGWNLAANDAKALAEWARKNISKGSYARPYGGYGTARHKHCLDMGE